MAGSGKHKVVIIGGGFGGLYTAKALGNSGMDVTLVDKRNFHLFQPLLYQVATGGLSPGDIASPLRAVLGKYRNIRVLNAEVTGIDLPRNMIRLDAATLAFDTLVVAAGARQHYFGNDGWTELAPPLKTIEDAFEMRKRILSSFEKAENESDPARREPLLTFVVVGGGPTGVELAGALAELAHNTLRSEFRTFDPAEARIILVEGTGRILPAYDEQLSVKAERALLRLGVTIRKNTLLKQLHSHSLVLEQDGRQTNLSAATVLWAAGIKGVDLGSILCEQANIEPDSSGRVPVTPQLQVPGFPQVYVIGDLANAKGPDGEPLPGVAPVAMQQGRYVARQLRRAQSGREPKPFRYIDKGSLAVIGRNAAVAEFAGIKFSGSLAWLIWAAVHIRYLIEFDNKLIVLIQWAWNYLTRKRGARLIALVKSTIGNRAD